MSTDNLARLFSPVARRASAALMSIALLCGGAAAARAGDPPPDTEVRAAVAANFTAAMNELTRTYKAATGTQVVASFGASGQLVAQIANGAPFDLMLAADDQYTAQLVDRNLAVAASRFVYARGKLVLWSSAAGTVDGEGRVLKDGKFARIAIANPKVAPYGRAAAEALEALGLYDTLQPRFVTGENIGQAQQFVASGSVPLGFVALAQVYALPEGQRGSWWLVPENLYRPLDQEAVLLKSAEHADAAKAFLAWLGTPAAQAIIRKFGYELPGAAK